MIRFRNILAALLCITILPVSAAPSFPEDDIELPIIPADPPRKSYMTVTGTVDYDYANEVLKLVNEERQKVSAQPLVMDTKLLEGAMIRSGDISIFDEHKRPDGTSWNSLAQLRGASAENIAYGYSTPAAVVNAWMNSEGHKANILNADYKAIGIGCFKVTSVSGADHYYWVQNFARTVSASGSQEGQTERSFRAPVSGKYVTLGIHPEQLTLQTEEIHQVAYHVINESVENPVQCEDMVYTVSDNCVTISSAGLITALSTGTANVSAENTVDARLKAECSVTVIPVEVMAVTLDKTAVSLFPQETVQLNAAITPENAADKTLTWSSDNAGIASVDNSGLVTAVKVVTAVITVGSANGKTASCTVTVKPVEVTSVTLDKTTASILVSQTVQLTASVKPDNATDKSLTWSSDKTSVATVNASGLVTGVSVGSAKITATSANGKTASCTVTVNPIEVTSVTLDKTTADIQVNGTLQLTASVKPDNATDKSVTWSSDKTSVATVNANGLVTGISVGTAVITAKGSNGKTAACTVTVKPIEVTSITLDKTTATVRPNGTVQLTASVKPDNATDKSVTWSSDKPAVATVNANGLVTGVSVGTAVITAKASNGKTAACTVTVSTVEVASITLDKTTASILVKGTVQLNAVISPADAADKTVTWSSDKTSVATVSDNGLVTGVSAGTAVITAKASNGKTATCTVTVKPIEVTSVSLDQTAASILVKGTVQLKAAVSPADAADKTVTWSSDKTAVATVSDNGLVTGVSVGTAVITARTANGKTASCTVTVKPIEADSVSLNETALTLKVDDEYQLTATVSPADATDRTITWSSDNPGIVKVDSNGRITALAEGSATITAAAANGRKATCKVTVEAKEIKDPAACKVNGFCYYNGKYYWYEGGVRQGVSTDPKCFSYDGSLRGREIYDPETDGWYWLDVIYDGAKAENKEVYMPYIYQDEADHLRDDVWINTVAALSRRSSPENVDLSAQIVKAIKLHGGPGSGKWVRYDKEGKMIKGWYTVSGKDVSLYPSQAGNTYY
ncbi:MAG: Ig-like domain-containing protein, partial [Solobacterium sp.]|nr:Ig-like domain-containing protein [Solobacterium sp.]